MLDIITIVIWRFGGTFEDFAFGFWKDGSKIKLKGILQQKL